MSLPSSTYDTATLVNPTSSLTDFTLIVDLSRMSAAWWAAVDTSDGTKGRAAKDSGPTELACDWIDFDNVAETGLLRVKWSGTLATTGTQTLRVYPPIAANASVAANATYGSDNAYDSDWAAYWPLHDEFDRTANGYDLTAQGGVTVGGATGHLGAATNFDGSDDSLVNTSASPGSGPDRTLIGWLNQDAGKIAPLIVTDNGPSNEYQRLLLINLSSFRAQESDGTTTTDRTNTTAMSAGTWYMLTGQFVSATARYAWLDKNKSGPGTVNVDSTGATDIGIARSPGGGNAIDGKIQHVQMHSVARSDEWIEYEYDQINDQATLWGTWTNTPVAGGISIPVVMHHRRMMGVS